MSGFGPARNLGLRLPTLGLALALVGACSSGDDGDGSAAVSTTTIVHAEETVRIELYTNGETGVAFRQRFGNAPRGSPDVNDHYCEWGAVPRFEISDGAGVTLDAGDFETDSDDEIPGVAFGPVADLGPPSRCELAAYTSLEGRPDVVTVTVMGEMPDNLFVNGEWVAEVTLAADEYEGEIEIEATQHDLV